MANTQIRVDLAAFDVMRRAATKGARLLYKDTPTGRVYHAGFGDYLPDRDAAIRYNAADGILAGRKSELA